MKNTGDTKTMLKRFGIILGAILVVLLITIVVFASVNSKVNDKQLLNILENASKKYYASHKEQLPKVGESSLVDATTLIQDGYMKSFDKLTKNTNCSANVTVTYTGNEYTYIPYVKCDQYESATIASKLKSTVVTKDAGLYTDGSTYYYKGEYVNNYIKIGDTLYRIISIDSKGNLKLISNTLTKETYAWDDRYNIEKDQDDIGINDYEKSRIRESLGNVYNGLSEGVKKYILNYEWCIDKLTDGSLGTKECTKTISDNLGLIYVRDFALASLDPNCNDSFSSSCKNYNYLDNLFNKNTWTMTALAENSYEAVMIISDPTPKKTFSSARVAISFYISGANIYTSGDGSEKSPYIVR